jgi:hypothetical protein
MSIRIIPQDELEKERETRDEYDPAVVVSPAQMAYNRRAERLREQLKITRWVITALCRAYRPRAGNGAVRPSAADGSHRAHQRSERPG